MESIEHLLADLAALDIKLWVENGTLQFDAPNGSFDAAVRSRVLAAKPELIALLEQQADRPSTTIAPERSDSSQRSQAPATASERRLATLWAEFLKTGEIGRDDDFFVLGGHSLLLMRLVHRIEAEGLGVINLAQAMGARTLAAMAALLDNHGSHQTDQPYPRDSSLAALWQAAATRYAQFTALVNGKEHLSYQQLDAWADRLANGLFAAGVRPGDTVALALPRAPQAVAAILAVLKCGAIYLPLDEKMPPPLVARLLATCDAHWLIADQSGRDRLSSLTEVQLLPLGQLASTGGAGALAQQSQTGGGDAAYVMFTSGSTGEPKGVLIPHRAVARLALDPGVLALKPGAGMAQTAPFGFDAATLEIWATLLGGARLVFIDDDALLQPARLENRLRESAVDAMWLTASLFNQVAGLRPQAFGSLTTLFTGGEVASVAHMKKVLAACPNLRLFNAYGPTENTTFTTLHAVGADDLMTDSVPIGRPIANTRVYLLDQDLSAVAAGAWGELCAAGDGLAIGYAGRPDLTDQVFVTLPGQPGERIYRTGDLARWRSDGVLEFGGRRDGQIKLRGHRIETSAIEAVLANCPGVQDALVLTAGDGDAKELVAVIASQRADESAWRRHLADQLPIYMMPARFIVVAALPLNANGKKDRSAVSRMLMPETADIALSDAQQRLWILQRLSPESACYNVPLAFAMQGDLDTPALQRALSALELRHPALRLCIRAPGGAGLDARQHLLESGALAPLSIDFSTSADPGAAADEKMQAEINRPFRLEQEAPTRAFLLRLGQTHWRLLLVIHHIACDGWSIGILLHDLAALYARETGASTVALPALEYQLADHGTEQAAWLASAAGRTVLERRIKRLSPAPEALDLPTDHPRPLLRNFAGATLHFPFPPSISRSIDQLAQDGGVSPYVVLLALVEVLLYRLCGHARPGNFALGALHAGRERAGLSGLVGFFVNTLVLPCRMKPDQTFAQHLANVKEEWLAALSDQQCPFAQLVDCLHLPRDLSRNPLFDVLVVWQDASAQAPVLPGLQTELLECELPFSKFDLSFHFLKKGREVELFLEYSSELFEPSSVTGMAQRLQALIACVGDGAQATLSQLDIWLPGEKKKVIEDFNDTGRALPTNRAITEPFLDCVQRNPNAPAVLSAAGEVLDYSRFARRAGAVAALLIGAGVGPGAAVAVLLPRAPDMLVAIYGILMAGAAYAPLDPEQPPARLRQLLDDLGQPHVFLPESLRAPLAACCQPLALPDVSLEAEPRSLAAPHDLAYIIFTSGSTGRPKGVLIEQQAVLNRILWMQQTFPIRRGDVLLQKTPITFDVSVWELFWWSWTGAAVAMLAPGEEKDPQALARAIEQHRVTTIHFVPSMLALFLDGLESGRIDARQIASLRRVFVSGEALDPALAERFNRLIYAHQGAQLHNLYGPTEATVDVSWQAASPWPGGDAVSIGRPIANTRLYILDPQQQAVPVGVAGEIAIGGVQVARGYLNRPELSAERFIADPFEALGRLYLSGDLGRWRSDGNIDYLGRSDWQAKIRGQRIEPGEIEHALERHPGITRAVVVTVMNQDLAELHAWLLCAAPPDLAAVRHFLRQQLPESMIPARFFPLEELPQTSNGKLDRQWLVQRSQAALTPALAEPSPPGAPCADGGFALSTRFNLDQTSETLALSFSFNPGLLAPDQADGLARRYAALIEDMTKQPAGSTWPERPVLPQPVPNH